jgi:enoyl-CoA hydratase
METLALAIEGGVATLTLDRPERMNAINAAMKAELAQALDVIVEQCARVVVVTGAGRAFCAGADIKERAGQEPTPAEFLAAQRKTHALFDRLATLDAPVIAAINGVALGGGLEIALCADIRIASASAKLGLTEVALGVIPAGGGTQRLPRLIGLGAAKRMVLTGQVLEAEAARALGLVDEVVAPEELLPHAAALAAAIAAQPPLAAQAAKRVMDRGMEADLATGLEAELHAAAILFATEDRKEGMRAFVEKRRPLFLGR